MPSAVYRKGIVQGWSTGELNWGADVNANLKALADYALDHWAADPSTTVGLTYGYRGGLALASGALVMIAGGSIALTNGATNYVERTVAGLVSANTTGFTAGSLPMAKVTTAGAAITAHEDWRQLNTHRTYDGRANFNVLTIGSDPGGTDLLRVGGRITLSERLTIGLGAGSTFAAGSVYRSTVNGLVLGGAAGSSYDSALLNGAGQYVITNSTGSQNVQLFGHLGQGGASNTFDLGDAVTKWRSAYFGTSVIVGSDPGGAQAIRGTSSHFGAEGVRLTDGSIVSTIRSYNTGASLLFDTTGEIMLSPAGTNRWKASTTGHWLAASDNSVDIGQVGANRPRNIYVAGAGAFGGAVTVGSTLGVTGATTLSNTLSVAEATTLAKHVHQTRRDGGAKVANFAIDWSLGNTQEFELFANVTITFSNTVAGAWYTLKLKQDSTGGRAVTWPAAVKWSGGIAPTLGGANKIDFISFYYDGTSYYGMVAAQDFS